MQDQPRGQVLVTGVDDPVYNAVVNVLSPLGFDVHRVPFDDYLRDHVQITPFDVIIAAFSLSSEGMDRFFKAVRARGSACHHSGVILIAPERHLDAAQEHIGHGANKVVSDLGVSAQLQVAFSDLLGVAPRIPVTTNARIKIYVEGKPIQSFCQTRNLSATGVLIRGFAHYPQGSKIDFEISLPTDTAPIRGSGMISRRAEKSTEHINGLGIKFTSFHGTDQHRLTAFLASQE